MEDLSHLGCGLAELPLLAAEKTRSISAENPRGDKGGGAKEDPDPSGPAAHLGRGWKARPCITLPAGATVTLAEIDGPGVIRHIWMTVDTKAYRDCVLRFFWDSESEPSVVVPLGDFFAAGHALRYQVNSLPVAVNPSGGFNCYWPMPFRAHGRITIENQHPAAIPGFYYQIDYALRGVPDAAAYFHAQWRHDVTHRSHPEYVIIDGVTGRGHYVGTFLAWTQLSNGWWGEGEIKFYLDGDREYPTVCGTGTEDYFGGAWCFGVTYSGAFLGYPLWRRETGEVPKHALYRWHVLDPIRFEHDLRVTIQALGCRDPGWFLPLEDDIASVAYWYQTEPHQTFPLLLSPDVRQPR